MKKTYAQTPNKIRELWNLVSQLSGQIIEISNKLSVMQKSLDSAWQEITSPRTVSKKGYEIDIKKCYLIERDAEGQIALDNNGRQKFSPLYDINNNRTSIVWDKDGRCWRFYAVYASGE